MSRRQALRRLGALPFLPFLAAACGPQPAPPAPAIGRPLPSFRLPDLDGRPQAPSGKAMLLNFWASWCPPCRAEMAGLGRLHARWRDAGLGLFGIAVDADSHLVREFVLQQRIAFPILWDRGGELSRSLLAVRAFPTSFLVGRGGVLAEVLPGERDWDAPPWQDAVRALLI